MSGHLVIYGAYGYTGELIVRRAVERGLRPVLSGRDPVRVARLAAEYGLEHRAVALGDVAALDRALAGVSTVLHCAGPFAVTSKAMADACLRAGVHYLDITGEIAVFEALARRDSEARARGVMLLPGVGFDVVPSDCLAAHLARRLPGAERLALAFMGLGAGLSRGTATTALMGLGSGAGGAVRRDGRIVEVPTAWRTRTIDFGEGPRTTVTIPWGDVATAYYSTGIPNIEVSMAVPRRAVRWMRLGQSLGPVLRLSPVRAALLRAVRSGPPGPSDEQRARGQSLLWGEAVAPDGRRVVSRLRAPEGYTLTAHAAVAIAERALVGDVRPGFATPSLAYGADFVLGLPGITRTDEM
ncbi:MAG: hypothetical protein RLZZ387_518 [Chloroflexota bacterium]|jgi:short subunit dehydrogenase-like uncharacterized protein